MMPKSVCGPFPLTGLYTPSHTLTFFSLVSSKPALFLCISHEFCLGHQEKPNVLAFHPQAEGLLASAGYDRKLLLWDLSDQRIAMEMELLPQPVCCWVGHHNRLTICSFSHFSCLLSLGAWMANCLLPLPRIIV